MTVETAGKEKGQVAHTKSPDLRPMEVCAQQPSPIADQKKGPPPPLKHGEQLTRDEFERRYEAMPHLKKAAPLSSTIRVTLKGHRN